MEDDVLLKDYNKHVNVEMFYCNNVNYKDYGKWYLFRDTFPLLTEKQTFIEVLCNGNPTFHSIWWHDDNTIRIRDYDFHRELLLWQLNECLNLYWRYVPDPPGNCGYDVG